MMEQVVHKLKEAEAAQYVVRARFESRFNITANGKESYIGNACKILVRKLQRKKSLLSWTWVRQ
jgi:hypothetical protein